MRYSLMLLLLLVCSGIKAQNSKIYTDTVVAGAFSGGIVHDGSLHLIASDRYDTLNVVKKRAAIAKLSKDFESSIIIISNGPKRELWIWEKNGIPEFIDEWNLDEMEIEEYLPLEIEKSGPNRLFWYAGGNMNGASGSFTGTASFRVGTYLYKNMIDCSVSADLGLIANHGDTDFNGGIGIMGRCHVPIKKLPLSPYGGIGVNLNFVPSVYFELALYTGMSFFVGPGSIDVGLQYGIKSGFGLTFGYTFRPEFKISKYKKK